MLAFINGLSPMHLLVIMVVALLLFGNRLPEIARSLGRSLNEFKKGLSDVNDNFKPNDQPREKLSPPREADQTAARTSEKATHHEPQ